MGSKSSSPSYASSVSTTWERRPVKISQRRRPPGRRSPEASFKAKLARWPRRQKLTLTIVSRGGPECWYEIQARGTKWHFPGWLDLETVMAEIYRDT